jgi:hypothetical protein
MRYGRLFLCTFGCLGWSLAGAVAQDTSSCAQAARVAPSFPARVPMEIVNNHVYVRVCYGDRQFVFILDTGAGNSLFDLAIAKQLGIQLGRSFRAAGGGVGTVEGAFLDGARVLVPGAGPVDVRSAIALGRVSLGEGFPMEGILGYNFIAERVLAIDYRHRELRLYDARSFKYDGPGAIIPITFERNHPHVEAEVLLADGTHIPGKFIVDVGAALALSLTKPFVERYKLRERVGQTIRAPAGGGVGGSAIADIGRVAGLRIGPYTLERPVTSLFGDSAGVFSDTLWDGNIGGEVLRRFTVYFDYQRKQMILEPHDETAEPFEADMSGARFRAEGDLATVRVMYVVAASPAAEAGLMVGDRLTAVDGIAVNDSTLRELRQRLRRLGERVSLTVQRGDASLRIDLTTRRIL